MPRLLAILGGLLTLACTSCSDGDARDRNKTGWQNDGGNASKRGDEEGMTDAEQIAAIKKILTDPKLREKLEERVPSLQRTEWVDKEGKQRLENEIDADRGPRDEKSIVAELTLNGGEARYADGVVTTVILAHLDWKAPMKVVDPGLSLLKFLPEVKTISLYNSTATDAGLRHLKGMSKLTNLDLGYTATTDEGLKHLADLTQLEVLGLGSTRITDAGLVHLQKMNKLRILDISVKELTEVGFKHVKELKQLRKMQVYVGMAQEDLQRLRKQMPDCEIVK